MQQVAKVSTSQTPQAKRGFQRAALIIAIHCFVLVFALLLVALISDILIFAQQLVMFVVAVLGAAVAFIAGFFLMIISIILIFGFYLLESTGFWPYEWAKQTFSEIIKDAQLTSAQVGVLIGVRIALLVCCVIIFFSAIVALIFASIAKKQNKKNGVKIRQGLTKAFSIIAIVFSVLGFFMALIVLLLAVLLTI